MLLGTGAKVGAIGIAAGIALSTLLTGVVRSQLYGVSALDPLTIAAACAVLFFVALAATFLPAWRAARIDPIVALRQR